jgi:hypothetical protein
MAERKIIGVVWRQIDPNDIELVYADGDREHVSGTHADAAEMARASDMGTVPTAVGTVRWVAQPPKARKKRAAAE